MKRATRQRVWEAGRTVARRAAELGLLVPAAALLVCLILIWGIAEIADEVMEGESAAADQWTLLLLREPGDLSTPRGPPWLQQAAVEFTTLGGTTVLAAVTLIGVSYLTARRSYAAAVGFLVAVVVGQLLSSLLKLGFARPRPDVVPHITEVQTLSFPSGHAMMGAVVWLALGAMLAQAHPGLRLKLYFLSLAVVMTVLIGLTRIYLGVHYPTDVLAGWASGAAWASLWWGGVAWWRHRRARRAAPEA